MLCFLLVILSCNRNYNRILISDFEKDKMYDFFCQKNKDLNEFCGETDSFFIKNKECKLFVLCSFYRNSFTKFTAEQLKKCDYQLIINNEGIIFQNHLITKEELTNLINNKLVKDLKICIINDLKNIEVHRNTIQTLLEIERDIVFTFVYTNERYIEDVNRPLRNVPSSGIL